MSDRVEDAVYVTIGLLSILFVAAWTILMFLAIIWGIVFVWGQL